MPKSKPTLLLHPSTPSMQKLDRDIHAALDAVMKAHSTAENLVDLMRPADRVLHMLQPIEQIEYRLAEVHNLLPNWACDGWNLRDHEAVSG